MNRNINILTMVTDTENKVKSIFILSRYAIKPNQPIFKNPHMKQSFKHFKIAFFNLLLSSKISLLKITNGTIRIAVVNEKRSKAI